MSQAEQIREYFNKNPKASYDEVAEAVKITNSTIRTNVCRDLKRGKCIRLEDGSLDYSTYFGKEILLTELAEWKNENRRDWVDMLTRAAEKETDSNTMRLLIKEANKLMKEVTN